MRPGAGIRPRCYCRVFSFPEQNVRLLQAAFFVFRNGNAINWRNAGNTADEGMFDESTILSSILRWSAAEWRGNGCWAILQRPFRNLMLHNLHPRPSEPTKLGSAGGSRNDDFVPVGVANCPCWHRKFRQRMSYPVPAPGPLLASTQGKQP